MGCFHGNHLATRKVANFVKKGVKNHPLATLEFHVLQLCGEYPRITAHFAH